MNEIDEMNDGGDKRDGLEEFILENCEKKGNVQEVSEAFYFEFVEMTDEAMRSMIWCVVNAIVDQINEGVLKKGWGGSDVVDRVVFWLDWLSTGRAAFTTDGQLGFMKPVGPIPRAAMRLKLKQRLESSRPVIHEVIVEMLKSQQESS